MSNSQEVEIYKNICEKLIDKNYNETMRIEIKSIIRSSDCIEIVFERLMAYFVGKV